MAFEPRITTEALENTMPIALVVATAMPLSAIVSKSAKRVVNSVQLTEER